jgi:hypothetical protein
MKDLSSKNNHDHFGIAAAQTFGLLRFLTGATEALSSCLQPKVDGTMQRIALAACLRDVPSYEVLGFDFTRLELSLMSRSFARDSGGTGKARCLARQLNSGTQNTSSKTYFLSSWAGEVAVESGSNVSLFIYFLPSNASWIVLV